MLHRLPLLRTNFDPGKVLSELDKCGATSFPVLPVGLIQELMNEAFELDYVQRERYPGKTGVEQDFWEATTFAADSLFPLLRDTWQALCVEKLSPWLHTLFPTPLLFNDLCVQQYQKGSQGITPHRDESVYLNLVCIFPLYGTCRFAICSDKQKSNVSCLLDAKPGNVIVMRGGEWCGTDRRPIHFVDQIEGPRFAFSLRQDRRKMINPRHQIFRFPSFDRNPE